MVTVVADVACKGETGQHEKHFNFQTTSLFQIDRVKSNTAPETFILIKMHTYTVQCTVYTSAVVYMWID